MTNTGTLKELGVKNGDVVRLERSPVEWVKDGKQYTIMTKNNYKGSCSTKGDMWAEDEKGNWVSYDCSWQFTIVSRKSEENDYNDGKWHVWNGGECPVHPETVVEVVTRSYGPRKETADYFGWWHGDHINPILAFRVITPYVEPVVSEYTGKCHVYHYVGQEPTTASFNVGGDCEYGSWTATHVDGKIKSFTWTADQ